MRGGVGVICVLCGVSKPYPTAHNPFASTVDCSPQVLLWEQKFKRKKTESMDQYLYTQSRECGPASVYVSSRVVVLPCVHFRNMKQQC